MWFIKINPLNSSPLFPLSVFLPRKLCFSYPTSEEKANLNSLFPFYTRSLFLPSCSVKADLSHCSCSCRMGAWSSGRRQLGNARLQVCPLQLCSAVEQWSSRGWDWDGPSHRHPQNLMCWRLASFLWCTDDCTCLVLQSQLLLTFSQIPREMVK